MDIYEIVEIPAKDTAGGSNQVVLQGQCNGNRLGGAIYCIRDRGAKYALIQESNITKIVAAPVKSKEFTILAELWVPPLAPPLDPQKVQKRFLAIRNRFLKQKTR